MEEQNYNLQELSLEEQKSLKEDLQEVLKKHDAEMSVTSTIHLMKRTPKTNGNTKEKADTTPKEGSESDSGEPTQG